MRALLCCALLVACIVGAHAAVETGHISSDRGFAFGGKFCFRESHEAGTIVATLNIPVYSPENHTDILMLLYDDQAAGEQGSWQSVLDHWDDWTCDQRVEAAMGKRGLLPSSSAFNADGTMTVTYIPGTISQTRRPRYWFVTFAACGSSFNDVSYRIHFEQLGVSNWNKEFGANEYGLNSLYLAFFLIFTILVGVNTFGTYKLQQRLSYVHPMIKLFLVTLLIEYISLFLLLLHYGSYAQNGVGILVLLKLGQVLGLLARCTFMLLLLLLAKGWTISHETLTHKWPVLAVVVSYFTVSIVSLIWGYAMNDPMRTTPSGKVEALVITLNVIFLIFASYFTVQLFAFSYRTEVNPAKARLYLILGITFVPWFAGLPLVSFAVFALDPWARERVVEGLTVTLTTVAYSVLIFLFWPSRAEEYFSIATPDVHGINEDYATL